MISFRPMSFHCSSTASDGLGAGLGGSFFAASCAATGIAAIPMANTTPTNLIHFVMAFFPPFRPHSGRALPPSDGRSG